MRQKEENMFSSLENTFSSLCLGAREEVWAPVGVAKVMLAGKACYRSMGTTGDPVLHRLEPVAVPVNHRPVTGPYR